MILTKENKKKEKVMTNCFQMLQQKSYRNGGTGHLKSKRRLA